MNFCGRCKCLKDSLKELSLTNLSVVSDQFQLGNKACVEEVDGFRVETQKQYHMNLAKKKQKFFFFAICVCSVISLNLNGLNDKSGSC